MVRLKVSPWKYVGIYIVYGSAQELETFLENIYSQLENIFGSKLVDFA